MPRKSGIPWSPCPEFLIDAIVLISTDGQVEPDQEVLLVTVRVCFCVFFNGVSRSQVNRISRMILISVGSVESFLHSPNGTCLTLEDTDDCFSSILQWKRDCPAVLRSIYVNFVDFSDDNEEGRQRGACNRIS